ncbi:SusD/RagB family nutrient-binding outer membrane lipoprotein [Maribacter sp. ACAM166]|uniref:SusD/RagB family nutrient-binding outer membrane lipoprotein n=1 Tax=Maribacter sp. ACAM166 TaxID=2508996 RepID=UPI0010FE5EB0|nr:SusD/RagB family nutrient-binding outer membrane lipoprotein [Maribacter sp. ACAM166]TLP82175.1 SusD/RagB family nutrient-binding outer membrane lipoprotein [Maribacter sp. ACAM166]
MKIFIKNVVLTLFSAGLVLSCETTELNLITDPNAVSPEQATPDFYLNRVQEEFARFNDAFGTNGSELTRMESMQTRLYQQAYSPAGQDAEWQFAYSSMLTDIGAMNVLATDANFKRHIGMGQVMEAFTIVTLVDFYGDVPYSEAIGGIENLNPAVDSGASIYEAALGLLDAAKVNFTTTDNAADPDNDYYYAGDWDTWVKLANSIKLKIYAQSRLVDAGAVGAFNAIITGGNYITSVDEDFQFSWGTNVVNPDSRHPNYIDNYTPQGSDDYMSHWMMNYMDNSKVDNGDATYEGSDPRIRYYYYRQAETTPGAVDSDGPNQQNLSCSVEPAPPHYVTGGFTFCYLPNGYWGRDHGDDDGTPPDGQLKTTYGVYPAGGEFDDSTFESVDLGTGAGGAGIMPIFLAQTVDFLRAEIAYASNDAAGAKIFLTSGIQKSMDKTLAFGELDADADLSLAPSDDDVADYIAEVDALYDAAVGDEKLNLIAKEFFVSLFGNGIDAYNFYRRTGYPNDLQPNREPNPGAFMRSFLYPSVYANNNSNVTQKETVTVKVFWDNNPDAGFPLSN